MLQTLEEQFGVRGELLSRVSADVHQYLQIPRPASGEEWVFIPLQDGLVRLVHAKLISEPGWVINIARERERIDVYLGVAPPQRELPLITDVSRTAR